MVYCVFVDTRVSLSEELRGHSRLIPISEVILQSNGDVTVLGCGGALLVSHRFATLFEVIEII